MVVERGFAIWVCWNQRWRNLKMSFGGSYVHDGLFAMAGAYLFRFESSIC
jgi:hypothetical protein